MKHKTNLIYILFVCIFNVACVDYHEVWNESANIPLVQKNKSSEFVFFDNYQNDTIKNVQVASFSVLENAFEQDRILIGMYFFNFPLLNNELSKYNYGNQSFLGNDSSNCFVYFMATDASNNYIFQSSKKVCVTLNFKTLKNDENYKYKLFRIKMPDFTKPIKSDEGYPKGYSQIDLYDVISGRFPNGVSSNSSTGFASLMNWEEVTDAEIKENSDNKNEISAKFLTDEFNYIYCLRAQNLPFFILKDVSMQQPGVGIFFEKKMPSEKENSGVVNYYMVLMWTSPVQAYFYKEFVDKTIPFEFSGIIGNYKIEPPVKLLDEINELYPSYNPYYNFLIEVLDDYSLEIHVGGIKSHYTSSGDLIYREISLPDWLIEKIQADFGWYDKLESSIIENTEQGNLLKLSFTSGTELYLNSETEYFKIRNNNLSQQLQFLQKITQNAEFKNINSELEAIHPYIEDEYNVNYMTVMKNGAMLIFHADANFSEMFQVDVHLKELPISLSKAMTSEIPNPNELRCFRCFSINGTSVFKIEDDNGKVVVYDANTYEKLYSQATSTDFPEPIKESLAKDFPSLTVESFAFYYIENKPVLSLEFLPNTTIQSVVYDFDGNRMGEVRNFDLNLLPEHIRKNITDGLVKKTFLSMDIYEIFGKQKFYKVYAKNTDTGVTKTIYFNFEGRYIMEL